jgi:hypothetical protein
LAEIILSPIVRDKIETLTEILFKEGYFSFPENAIAYTDAIYDFINTIPRQKAKSASNLIYGKWYCRYQANRNTSWYITFDKDRELYIIRNIFNNHSHDYPEFIGS